MAAISEIAASNHQTVGPRPARAAKRRSKRRPKAVKRRSKSGQMAVKKGVGRSRTISPEFRRRANDRARGGQKLSKWSKSGQKLVKVVKRPFRHQAAGQAATGTAPKRHHEKRPKENGQRKMVKGKWPKENGQNDGRKGGPGRRRRRAANRGQIASWSNRSEGFLGFFLGGGVQPNRKTKKGGNFVKQCYSNYADEFIQIVFTYYWRAATFGAKKIHIASTMTLVKMAFIAHLKRRSLMS